MAAVAPHSIRENVQTLRPLPWQALKSSFFRITVENRRITLIDLFLLKRYLLLTVDSESPFGKKTRTAGARTKGLQFAAHF
jgi:hypothetical protein